MLFRKKDHLVGLDIGSRSIKVGEVTHSKKGHQLRKFGSVDTPSGAIEGGVIHDLAAVSEAIRALFSEHRIKEKNVAISIGGDSVIVKTINMQKMEEEELAASIPFEAEQYIPYDISDVNLDYQILGENEYNPGQMSVLLVAVKKEMVDEYIELIDSAGLNLRVIDVDAFALQNIYEASYGAEETVEDRHVALVDIGAVKTSLNILKGTNSLFMRDISLGCEQINERIMTEAGIPEDDVEAIKLGTAEGTLPADTLHEIVSQVTADWCSEIAGELNLFYSTYSNARVERIILSGGGGNIATFRELLARQTETDVDIIDPFQGLDPASAGIDPGRLAAIAPQAAISLGLAIRRVDDK